MGLRSDVRLRWTSCEPVDSVPLPSPLLRRTRRKRKRGRRRMRNASILGGKRSLDGGPWGVSPRWGGRLRLTRHLKASKMECGRRPSSSCTRRPLVVGRTMPILLYSVSDSPPTLAVRLALEALRLEHELIDVDFANGEHLKEDYAKINPQREVPTLDDNGFLLSESVAILQYLTDKYSKDDKLYPREPQKRAIVNHRLLFNLTTYYRYISEHVMAPIFYAYKRTPDTLKKTKIGLSTLNSLFERDGTKYAAADHVTIADFPLVTATACLEAIHFNISSYPLVAKWYETFKTENPQLWAIVQPGMLEVRAFEQNPPDLSHITHPLHPTLKS